jgi:hypothetical protein
MTLEMGVIKNKCKLIEFKLAVCKSKTFLLSKVLSKVRCLYLFLYSFRETLI